MEDKIKYGYDFDAEKMSFEDFAYKWLESVKDILICENTQIIMNIPAFYKRKSNLVFKNLILEIIYRQ